MSFFSPLTTSGFICHLNKVSSKPAAAQLPVSTAWIEMPPEDVEQLIKTLQETLAELSTK
jgi:hypothetical protein